MPRIRELLREAAAALEGAGIESARFDAMELMQCALGLPGRAALFSRMEEEPGAAARARFLALVERRRARYPLQYLLGFWEFYGRRFVVREGVLIPRPQTELLVDRGIALLRGKPAPRVLDLCSGSGALGLTLALEVPGAAVDALELSPPALAVLRENAAALGVPARVIAGDVRTFVPAGRYDLIVSNPPYIDEAACDCLQPEVLCEPRLALAAGEGGMEFYRVIAARYQGCLAPGGALLLEAGVNQAPAIAALLRAAGYGPVGIDKDLDGIERAVYAPAGPGPQEGG